MTHPIAPVPSKPAPRPATLRRPCIGHRAGEAVTVGRYLGSGMYQVQFANGEHGVLGRSSLLMIETFNARSA